MKNRDKKQNNRLFSNLSLQKSGLEAHWSKYAIFVLIITVIIFTAVCAVVVSITYFNSVKAKIESVNAGTVHDYFALYADDKSSFEDSAGNFVTSFTESDIIQVVLISSNGNPLATTSGTLPDDTDGMEDFQKAVDSEDRKGVWKGYSENSEHIMCITHAVTDSNENIIGYARYTTSLKKIDIKITEITFAVIFVILAIAMLIFYLNKSFIRSMVRPINELNEAAKKIASGKFEFSVEYNGDDEIGQLYSSIDNMTQELGRIDKMKNDFITTVSHELRTPLTAIKGWGETIMDLGVNNQSLVKDGVKVIIDESERLSDLVEDLLDFSKFQSEEFTLRTQTIDVLAELDETAFSLKEHALRDGIEFVCTVPEYPAIAVADPNRIRQVFVNIIGNAIKYTGEGGKVEVVANVLDNTLIIFIRDNGCGIAEKDLPHVKEKFYKANDTVHGNGIGLAVADEIIKLHGGNLDIKSEEGTGTIVRITLPLADNTSPTGEKNYE